jgi:RHS repeat-associated protein
MTGAQKTHVTLVVADTPTRLGVAPARSDTILVTTNRYKDSGDANAIVDPMAIETHWENDKAGRRVRLIEGIVAAPAKAWSDGCMGALRPPSCEGGYTSPPPSTPRITEFLWHPSGQLARLTLLNADTGDQITRWIFGTSLADSAVASNSLVRTKIYPESDDRPAPASDGPDGVYSRLEYQYNRQGQQTQFKDADGTTHAYVYDKVGRMTEDKVTVLADGLNGTVRRIGYSYDPRSLVSKVTSYNAATGGTVVNEAAFEYDSFLQLAADKQSHAGAVTGSTPKVTYTYETGGTKNSIRRVSTTYPTAARVLQVQYGAANSMDDQLSRVSALQVNGEASTLVDYTYCGVGWQVRVGYAQPGLELKYRRLTGAPVGDSGDPYSGYDRFSRSVDLPWVKTSDQSVVERSQYGFDRDSRRTWQKRPLTDTQDLHHDYDALSQVIQSARGSLNLNTTAISGIPALTESWEYDPTGNWRAYGQDYTGGGAIPQRRVHDRGNRLTQIEGSDFPLILDRVGRVRQSAPDASGAGGGRLNLEWDAWSRIVGVKSNTAVVGTYTYDGLHRRVTRLVSSVTWHSYYSDAWRPLEERKNAETTVALSYLWGARHRDDLARRDRAASGTTLNETRYVLMDYFNASAITDAAGVMKERYAYSAFGLRSILNPDYSARTSSECAFEFGFQGQFLDMESGLMNYGYRSYSPYLGRWMCKDPIAEEGGFNLYTNVGNGPINAVDYLGLRNYDSPAPGPNLPPGKGYPNEPRLDPADPDTEPEVVHTSTWQCEVSFSVKGQDKDPFCPETIVGTGNGNPVDSACDAAKRSAESKVKDIGKCCELKEELGRSAEKITTPMRFPGGVRLV